MNLKHNNRIVIILSVIILLFYACSNNKSNKKLPNFLVILIDDLGSQDIGCYGQEYINTPNIDHLASQGMRWTDAYSSCPVCSPTRVAILTGKNQARVHFTGHITRIGRHRHPEDSRIIPPDDLMDIPYEEIILPEALKPAGYTSISIGKWHVGREGYWPTDLGFDYNVAGWTHGMPPSHFYPYENPAEPWNSSIPTLNGGSPGEYLTDRLTDEAIKFIKTNKDKPFFVYLSHYAVHTPIQAPDKLIDKYKGKLEGTGIDPVYAAMVESVDLNTGRLLDLLEELNLTENTVVIFASDNGALQTVTDTSPYREGKGHLYEGGIRVPFIMRWPGHIKPGIVSTKPTTSADIYATITDIARNKAKPNSPLDGRSLLSDIKNGQNNKTNDLFWYYPHYAPQGNKPGAAVRSGKFKLIEFYDPYGVELYDLSVDIGENNNLSDSLTSVTTNMLEKLHYWLDEVNPIMHTMNPSYVEKENE